MVKTCKQCRENFEVTAEDLAFYNKVSPVIAGKKYLVPPPTLCPDCRQQRRLAWRSKEYFFRPCDLTKRSCLSIYPPEAQVITYSSSAFFSDDWDGLTLGREFDFSRPFFEQFNEIYQQAPKHTANSYMNENCEYIINAHENKNCYLADEIDYSRDCLYGYNIQKCTNVLQGFYIRDSQLCYETQQAENCYEVFFSHNVFHCTSSAFLKNCRNCRNCLFCVNLRGAQYCIFNKKVTKEEFEQEWHKLFNGSYEQLERSRKAFTAFIQSQSLPATIQVNSENFRGDYLFNTKNCLDSFNIDNCQDCRFCSDIHHSRDAYDTHIYEGELMYECLHAGPKAYHNLGVILCWFCTNIFYSCELHNCKFMFGCSSLKRKEYCILNKQYTKEEYEKLVPRIIEHMQNTGEWGEFFPVRYSPFGYNETMAVSYFPLEKEEARAREFHWRDRAEKSNEKNMVVPDQLDDFQDHMLNSIFASSESGKAYKIIAKELEFHRKYNIPLPRNAPQERMRNFVRQNPRKLWDRTCMKCGKAIQTTYSPDRPETVYCEACYLAVVY